MLKFLQVTLYPNSAHTGKYNEIIPDTEEIPEFTEEEVERAINRMKRHKAQGVDGITSDIIKLGGLIVLTYLTNIFNNILKTKQIPDSWHEAKWSFCSKRETLKTLRTIGL